MVATAQKIRTLEADVVPLSTSLDNIQAREAAAEFATNALAVLQDSDNGSDGFDSSKISPALIKLGVAIGLLEAVPNEQDSYQLNQTWFENPLGVTGENLKTNGATIASLLAELLGEVAANELGIPSQDLGALGVWNPIPNPKTDQPTGFYLVNYPKDQDNPAEDQIFGIGVLHSWDFGTSASGPSKGPSQIDVRVWGLLPLLEIGDNGLDLVLGQQGYPLNMGAFVGGADNQPILDEQGLSFNGVKFSALLDVLGDPVIQLSVVLEQLQLPTETAPADRNLSEIAQITPPELLATISTLFVAALERFLGQDSKAAYLLPIFGLSPMVPNSEVRLPLLRWDLLLSQAQSGGSLGTPFINWFNDLLNTESAFATWMNAISSLLGNQSPEVQGSGTQADPYSVVLLSDDAIGTLSLTAVSNVDTVGTRYLLPGFHFAGKGKQLGSTPVQIVVQGQVDLAQFSLSTSGQFGVSTQFLQLAMGFALTNTTSGDPLFEGTIDQDSYRFGSLSGGVSVLHSSSGGLRVVPAFQLVDVATPTGEYDRIDLTQPGQLVEQAINELYQLIDNALQELFGLTDQSSYGHQAAILLGVLPPDLPAGVTWPSNLTPPFNASQLIDSFQDPVAALASYYRHLVSGSDVGGKVPFYYLLEALGNLLNTANRPAISIGGQGSLSDPWLIQLTDESLPASLAVSIDRSNPDIPRLTLGLQLAPQINFGSSIELDLAITVQALALDLPTTNSALVAQIFPGLGAQLSLPQTFTTPTVAGAAVSISELAFYGFWSPYGAWEWNLKAGQPAVIVDGNNLPVGQPMELSDSDSLAELVTKQAATFAPIVVALMGIAVYRTGSRPGLALNAIFGLLPNLTPFVPSGLQWPQDMPVMTPNSFSDPIGDIKKQLNALLANTQRTEAVMALLGWSVDSAAQVPTVIGSGSYTQPFAVPVQLPGDLDLAIWTFNAGQTLGLGLQRRVQATLGDVATDTQLLLRIVEVGLTGSVPTQDFLPSFRLQSQLTPSSPLPINDGSDNDSQLISVVFGLEVALDSGNLALQPQVVVNIRDQNGDRTIDLQQLQGSSSQFQVSFYAVVNLAMAQLLTPMLSHTTVKLTYDLLSLINLTLPLNDQQTQCAIDTAGWTAMLADPLGFFRQRGTALFMVPETRAQAISWLEAVIGITLPTIPEPLLQVLAALELVEPSAQAYAPRLYDWVAIIANPSQQLQNRFTALIQDQAKSSALMGALATQTDPITVGPVQLTVSEGAVIELSILKDQLPTLGDILTVNGNLKFDLRTHQLTATLGLYSPPVKLAVMSALSITVADQIEAELNINLAWGDGSQPMPETLTLYPFSSNQFIDQVTVLAPTFALSTFFTQVVDARLLTNYPLARTVLSAFGLVFEDTNGHWYTKSPLGLFKDPLGWLLGDAVLGQDGHLNIATLSRILATVSETQASNGIGIKPIANGARIFGLPYGQQIDLVADTQAELFTITPGLSDNTPLSLVNNVSLQALSFSLSLGANFQPGFAGNIAVSGKVTNSTTLLVQGGYDKGFLLSAGQMEGETKKLFQILPFPGWQTLVVQAAQQVAQALLRELTDKLLDQLSRLGSDTASFITNLRNAGTALDVAGLVNTLISNSDKGADVIATDALRWLSARLSSDNASATVEAVAGLISPYFDGVSTDAGLIKYRPSDKVPITLVTGVQSLDNTRQVGLWLELNLPASSKLLINFEPTGVGIPVQDDGTLVTNFEPQLNFQLSVLVALEGDTGPKLGLRFNTETKTLVLGIDPAGQTDKNSRYYRELLPTFFSESDPSQYGSAVISWLESILINIVPRYLSIIVLNQTRVSQWLDQPLFPGGKGPKAGNVLIASQLLTQEGPNNLYMLNSLSNLEALTLPKFLAGFLRALLAESFQLIEIGSKGGIWLGPRQGMDNYFGVRVMVPDLTLKAVPYITFQLGDEDTEWIQNAGGDANLEGGVALYLPISTEGPDFGNLLLELVNIGLDFHGKQNQNLVQLSRFSLRAIQPRGLITFDFSKPDPVQSYGGGVTLTQIGISLAPNIASGKSANPVAQNLLGSGTPQSTPQGSSDKQNPATNPSFSVRTSYVKHLYVELFNDEGDSTTELWFPVQRSFGPLHANKIGVGWEQSDKLLDMLFDGSVSLAGLYVGLEGLKVGVPVTTPLDFDSYSLALAGLEVSFESGSVALSGGFLKNDNPLRYDGSVMVKAASFSLMALGSYALVPVDQDKPDGEKAPSLFIFVNLNIPLGPDPAFFITGIAAGFAYNRNLQLPEPGAINTYPLVQGAVSSSVFGGDSATPESALTQLSEVVYPEIGQYWVAAGLQFTTYELLSTFAMLVVRFGKEFALDLIGVSSASFPPAVSPSAALAYVELGLLVSFHPDDGVLSARAQLTPNSFLLAPDCRLTGGFAAFLWFSGEYAGDFVITLGGYNPAFKVPEQYPLVPRLGFNWPQNLGVGSLIIDGGAYFALTPSAIMAGGYLRALFQLGPLRAWFDAGVNFLIQWQPFYFDLEGHVSIGASISVTIAGVRVTLSAQIGAKLHMWGPPIAGEVGVDWYVISFTIPFGDTNQSLPSSQPLGWDSFQENFLPPLQTDQGQSTQGLVERAPHPQLLQLQANTTPLTQAYTVLKLQVKQGLVDDYPNLGWFIQSPFVLQATTVIPATIVSFGGSTTTFSGPGVGIQPMAQPSITSPLQITLQGLNSSTQTWETVNLDARGIQLATQRNGAPGALWSKTAFDPNGVPEAKTIPNSIMGITLTGSQVLTYVPVGPIALSTLAYVDLGPLPLPFTWTPQYIAKTLPSQNMRAQVISDTIMDLVHVIPLRNGMLAALRAVGQPALNNPSLVVLQANVANVYQSPPSLAPLGVDLAEVPTEATLVSLRPTPQVRSLATVGESNGNPKSKVIGTVRRYRVGTRCCCLGKGTRRLNNVTRPVARAKWQSGEPVGTTHSEEGLKVAITTGATALLKLNTNAAKEVTFTGQLPLRLLSFNESQELIQHVVVDPCQANSHVLPEIAEELVATGTVSSADTVSGWHIDSEWTRLNQYYFMGDCCVIRTQAPPRPHKRQRRGQVLANTVLKANQVQGGAGQLLPGWVETLFHNSPVSIAIIVRGSTMPRIQLLWTEELANPVYAEEAVVSVPSIEIGDLRVYLYDVPPRPQTVSAQLAVLIRPSASASTEDIQGVLGFAQTAEALQQSGLAGELVGDTYTLSHIPPETCQLSIT
ncbi:MULTISPECIES: DUF6603 domain-containing protein [unclassified Moorena]|uniref:DUF6603 domain-containing protein n=1 Tax=unclassified Moorena TaxID=2683338 RepID=UPI0013C18E38|nr:MULTISPECIES: DUF6603 domain-containing protein [unclassified Moorena]NEO04175.1 hypothetical protein [Moorena sp. SIO3I8]NEQ57908.1 hypothetical protein [Moorena sp. SIO4A1]